MPAQWELIDSLPFECRPHAIRGDYNYFNEANLVECEKRGIPYLFKLRQTAKVKNLISLLEQEGGWVDCGQGVEGIEGEVRLGGWNCKRRVIVARRLVKQDATEDDKKALPLWFLFIGNAERRKILLTNSKTSGVGLGLQRKTWIAVISQPDSLLRFTTGGVSMPGLWTGKDIAKRSQPARNFSPESPGKRDTPDKSGSISA